VRELEERERKESKKLADEDALRKIRVAEETIEHLQKKLAATKQVRGTSTDEQQRATATRHSFHQRVQMQKRHQIQTPSTLLKVLRIAEQLNIDSNIQCE